MGGRSGFNLGERLESVWADGQGLMWARIKSQCGRKVRFCMGHRLEVTITV